MLLPLLYPVFVLIYLEELKRMMQTPLVIDAATQPELAAQYAVVNAATGEIIPDVVFVDMRIGMYETHDRDSKGRLIVHNGEYVTCCHYAPIRLERIRRAMPNAKPKKQALRYVGNKRRREDRARFQLIEGGRA